MAWTKQPETRKSGEKVMHFRNTYRSRTYVKFRSFIEKKSNPEGFERFVILQRVNYIEWEFESWINDNFEK